MVLSVNLIAPINKYSMESTCEGELLAQQLLSHYTQLGIANVDIILI